MTMEGFDVDSTMKIEPYEMKMRSEIARIRDDAAACFPSVDAFVKYQALTSTADALEDQLAVNLLRHKRNTTTTVEWVADVRGDHRKWCAEQNTRRKRDREKIADSGLWKRSIKLLTENKIEYVDQLTELTTDDLLSIKGVGMMVIDNIRQMLWARGLDLAPVPQEEKP